MLENRFDPYDALIQLNENQQLLLERQRAQAEEIKSILTMITEQQQQIDILVQGLASANQANVNFNKLNEDLMRQLLSEINKNINNYSTQGNH